ncbi:glutamyl-tRNA reductase [Tessaracoccus sp. OH4464_COT-324]|uniref:glutamyl-tRNA reductase n=1 Tax=Tessaracoccus sp. OH4464_COT-324 TaxID=2491059 RepID=UPI000F63AB56|nr:glutamyl-tRNA reductase [Tessaracoccus sp. OH4464_COT-324]RRD47196.1 glutamyl-tRNA reductase [Tessaracoccus sp. OH4464_COT-324]
MAIRVFSIQHDRQGLSEVERISQQLDGLAACVRDQPGVSGVTLLATCNRVELLMEGDAALGWLRMVVDGHFDVPPDWDVFQGEGALRHVFSVAAGLSSMVVGEREISGQLRRALGDAQEAGRSSQALNIVVEEALKTSRLVANRTNLDSAGRSVVNEGLRLVELPDWSRARVLILGTGAYAGAVVAALRARGAGDIVVHSASGRAGEFARRHRVAAVTDLSQELPGADLVVTCRGRGPVVFPHHVRAGMKLLDLSLNRDVDRLVDRVEGVSVVDLAAIQAAIQPRYAHDSAQAEALVEQGIANALARLRSRAVDHAVATLREVALMLVEDELGRLPNRPLSRDDVAHSLRRLATRLLHVPSARARQAAEEGRAEEYLAALDELCGIGSLTWPGAADGQNTGAETAR